MLSSLLRPKRNRRRVEEHSPFSSPYVDLSSPVVQRRGRIAARHASADFTETEDEDGNTEDNDIEVGDEEEVISDEDHEDGGHAPLLPIFSAAHLDSLPVYNLTHAIRLIVLSRTETTLTWDQLRSPQVSQFLVKPMQQQIRTSHFNRATLYALMANCLQFQKEAQANPANDGNSRTRAMVCELLAVKILKEYRVRELIDALSYDFFPLQGLAPESQQPPHPGWEQRNRARPAAARISTLEVAIRASAKKFLAHPTVVEQLEAIWDGAIVIHSAADNLHRSQLRPHMPQRKSSSSGQHLLVPGQNVGYGSTVPVSPDKQKGRMQAVPTRRTVTLYDARDASLFKLSRLRVPRYRQFFSTCSLAILLGLFVAVLKERSMDITSLEIVFWFWSAGFMLDEVVGFTEQGFSLYIMSFWNTFDVGILLLLIVYYCMRLYGILLVDVGKHDWNSMAYDVLATNAILLFPRLFSVLDHYRYFSQLLIAFRLMAVDLAAVSVLILIACSGFFVAFTLSFGENEYDAAGVAYKIFQILMGFTPAAWEAWETYNPLGKAILVLFLFMCHFLVVTILVSVLTNSFMSIVANSKEEHQFLFAVNTIAMGKDSNLFSYVAPTNIFAWILTPCRLCLPFKLFIKINRTIIKVTHLPLLFSIYVYEKIFLARAVFDPTDLVANRGRKRFISFQDTKSGLFSPSVRMRQESVAGIQKDNALDAVFQLAPRPGTLQGTRKSFDRRTQNVVNNWMDHQGEVASPPFEDSRSAVDRLERRRQARQVTMMRCRATRSVASDPAEFVSTGAFPDQSEADLPTLNFDGDDELVTNDEDEAMSRMTFDQNASTSRDTFSNDHNREGEDYFTTPRYTSATPAGLLRSSPPKRRIHERNASSTTILYKPVDDTRQSSASPPKSRPLTARRSNTNTGANTPSHLGPAGSRTPRSSIYTTAKTKGRPVMPSRRQFQSVPDFNLDSQLASRPRRIPRKLSSLDMGMSDLGLDNNAPGMLGAVPSSFATQMAMATGGLKAFGGRDGAKDTDGMMGRLMLARMKTLEEGFAEVVKEFRGMRTAGNSSVEGNNEEPRRDKGKGKEKSYVKKRRVFQAGGMVRSASEVDFKKSRSLNLKIDGEQDDAAAVVVDDFDTPESQILQRYVSKGSSL